MSAATSDAMTPSSGRIPPELARLRERIAGLPGRYREALAPMAEEAVEESIFRGRVLALAREGLERYRLDLAIARFDLEATRREQEALRRKVEALGNP
jgi:hypothetical protein